VDDRILTGETTMSETKYYQVYADTLALMPDGNLGDGQGARFSSLEDAVAAIERLTGKRVAVGRSEAADYARMTVRQTKHYTNAETVGGLHIRVVEYGPELTPKEREKGRRAMRNACL
jgi:hypothetical protein